MDAPTSPTSAATVRIKRRRDEPVLPGFVLGGNRKRSAFANLALEPTECAPAKRFRLVATVPVKDALQSASPVASAAGGDRPPCGAAHTGIQPPQPAPSPAQPLASAHLMGIAPPAVRYERVRQTRAEGASGPADGPRVALDLLRCAIPAPKRRRQASPAAEGVSEQAPALADAADGAGANAEDVYDLYEEWREGDEAPGARGGGTRNFSLDTPLAELFWEDRSDGDPDEFGWDEDDDGADSDSNGEVRCCPPPRRARLAHGPSAPHADACSLVCACAGRLP